MISRWIELVCDECGTGTGDLLFSGDARVARRAAREDGWCRAPDGRDICPKCHAKLLKKLGLTSSTRLAARRKASSQ